MCNTPLLDLETLYQVKRAAPKVTDTPPNEARLVLAAMWKHTDPEREQIGMDDRPYWSMYIGDMFLPQALTPKRVGRICRAMGLTMIRRNTGYMVVWTQEQLDILCKHFGLVHKVQAEPDEMGGATIIYGLEYSGDGK